MLRATFKRLLANKLRLIATALAVSLGVAFLAGTLVLTDTVTKTFDRLFASVYSGNDAVVRATSTFSGPDNSGAQRGRVDQAVLDAVKQVPGVGHAEGDVLGYARIVDKDGDPLGNPANGAPTLGGSWSGYERLNPFRLVAGARPERSDEVVIDKQSADAAGFQLGDLVTVLAQGPPRTYRLVGIV
jgi:putative ABC transport system permease protein